MTASNFFPDTAGKEHVCTPETCPEPGAYYVTCVDGNSYWKMSGPYISHRAALDDVDRALRITCKSDGRAWFMSWGTTRMIDETTEPGRLQKAGLIHLPDAEA